MKHLRRFNELFDSEEMKNQNEIPYLKGEINNKYWKPFEMSNGEETVESFCMKLEFEYPILDHFNRQDKMVGSVKIINLYGTSYKKYQGEDYYCQMSMACDNDTYKIITIIRNLHELEDTSKWKVQQFYFESIEESYQTVNEFLRECIKLNVIREQDKFSARRN